MRFTTAELQLIDCALSPAAGVYEEDAQRLATTQPRVAAQFKQQAEQARAIADRIAQEGGTVKFDYVEKRIGSYFLPLLVNGDASGLEASEIEALTAFQLEVSRGRVPSSFHWTVVDDSHEDFTRCAVTGLMGECETVRYYFTKT